MAKKPSVSTVSSGYQGTTTINNNFSNLRDGFDNTLSLDGSTPNAMQADLDLNSNDIINVNTIDTNTLEVTTLNLNGTVVSPEQVVVNTIAWSNITDYGTTGNFWADQSPPPRIWRTGDRLFIGAASTSSTGNKFNTGGTFLTTQMDAFWMERGATTLSVSDYGEFGGTFAVRTSDKSKSGYYGTASIGVLGIVENDDNSVNQTIGWAGYFEANRNTNNKTVYGLEVSLKNKGSNVTPQPYNTQWGTVGIWLPGGGDAFYNGVNANPCGAAIIIGRGDDQGNTALPMSWNRGIVFRANGITGTDGTTGTGIAIDMAKGHVIRWAVSTGSNGASLYSSVNDSTKALTLEFANDQFRFLSGGGAGYAFKITKASGQDNQVEVTSEISGTSPQVTANGNDTNIDLRLSPKGTGNIRFGTHTGTADVAISGYITIKDSGGTLRKLAVIT